MVSKDYHPVASGEATPRTSVPRWSDTGGAVQQSEPEWRAERVVVDSREPVEGMCNASSALVTILATMAREALEHDARKEEDHAQTQDA